MRTRLVLISIALILIAGCRSRTIMVSIHNADESPIRNVEVQYPGGSYGAAQIGPGYTHGSRIKPRSAGNIQIGYVDAAGHQQQKSGPRVEKDQEGLIEVTIKGSELTYKVSGQ
jgi:hypothetical protein